LTAECEGSTEPSSRLHVELDVGGDCKHVVALLLSYLHKPEEFSEQKSVKDLLSGLEKGSLVALVTRLVERNPGFYSEIEMAIPVVEAGKSKSSPDKEKRQTQVSEQTYRKQVGRILKQSGYDGSYYDDWDEPKYIGDLEDVLETAKKF
jgi:uncharacterized Zn finger protein